MLWAIVLLWLLGFADIVLTAVLIHLNIMEEWNPVLLWFFTGGGLGIMVLFKVSELTLFLGFVALCIERVWITRRRAHLYVFLGIIIYLTVAVPAYVAPFFLK